MTLATGEVRLIDEGSELAFFRAIEQRTGLDRPMAEAIMLGGKPILHPDARFEKRTHLERKNA